MDKIEMDLFARAITEQVKGGLPSDLGYAILIFEANKQDPVISLTTNATDPVAFANALEQLARRMRERCAQ